MVLLCLYLQLFFQLLNFLLKPIHINLQLLLQPDMFPYFRLSLLYGAFQNLIIFLLEIHFRVMFVFAYNIDECK